MLDAWTARAWIVAWALASSAALAPLGASGAQKATLDCANESLPAGILDGTAAKPGAKPLPLIETRAPKARLHLAVAADNLSRDRGLMCVTRLRPHAGMIFVFAQTGDWGFWMKNTVIPLDQIWVEPDGKVDTVAADVPKSALDSPDDQIAHRRGNGLYVIELTAGEAAADGIVPGSYLVIPPLHTSE